MKIIVVGAGMCELHKITVENTANFVKDPVFFNNCDVFLHKRFSNLHTSNEGLFKK